jgi:hypothetical protein
MSGVLELGGGRIPAIGRDWALSPRARVLRPDSRGSGRSRGHDPFRKVRRGDRPCAASGPLAQVIRIAVRLRLRNRAGARWHLVSPRSHRTLRRLPVSRACHTGFRCQGVASGESSARRNGVGGVCPLVAAAPTPFRQAALNPPPVPLGTEKPARPLGPCEDGSGCDEIEGGLRSPAQPGRNWLRGGQCFV